MKNDGGPAFPVGSGDVRDPMGMTLRDYFAGQALAGILADSNVRPGSFDDLSGWCYKVADAMLAERDKADV